MSRGRGMPPLPKDFANAKPAYERGRSRKYPFSMLPDWVLLSDVLPGAKTLYWALYVHVNQDRARHEDDRSVWPGQKKLLEISGVKSRTTLRKYLKELHKIGAVEWKTDRNPYNPLRSQTVYVVHDEPEDGYTGPACLSDV